MSAAMQVLLALALVSVCSAGDWVYITNPIEGYLHPAGEEVDILVNSLTSTDAMVPYEYYTLPFCAAPENTRWQADNLLGSALWGDSIMSSPYSVSFLKNMTCVSACPLNDMAMLNKDELQQMKRFILDGYRGNMILDKLPALRTSLIDPSPSALAELCSKNQVPEREKEVRGYPLGSCKNSEVYINNHLSFTVKYNEKVVEGQKLYFVVGFYVVPRSFAEAGCASQQRMTTALPKGSKQKEMHWTYSVSWELDPTVQWVTRWDNYLNSSEGDKNARAHWLKIAQFLIVVLCLSAIVAVILMRTLHLDFNRYNNPENEEEMQEEVGWKLVHTEVFRPPPYPNLFAALIGTGTQLYLMVVITLMIAMAGFLSPAHRGWFLTALIFLFILMSIVNGFVTGMLQMMFSVKQWKTIILSGLCFPGFMFSLWTISEILLANKHAANAVPIGTYFIVLLMWIGIYVPQMVLGASFAFRLPPIENTLRYSTQKKTVPPQRWWFSWIATILNAVN
ncbi:Transmembrane 9 superfamily member 7 [Diplonema papillatum]|nr:Transmembrane 9 superfamily member 7 [Diplonema papillatum]